MAIILSVDWEEFKNEINILIEEGESIYEAGKIADTEDKLTQCSIIFKDWVSKSDKFLQNSFSKPTNYFASDFIKCRSNRSFRIPGKQQFHQRQKDFPKQVKDCINLLKSYIRIMGVCDVYTNPNEVLIKERAKFLTEDILELILDKLYELYDNYRYEILPILEGNGIVLKKRYEEKEYINILRNWGYVNTTDIAIVDAQLTLEGRLYVEDKIRAKSVNYENIDDSKDMVFAKLDEILKRVKNLEYGQQVIYEDLFQEIKDLKDWYGTLNKKSWGQLLKGKLIDLFFGKAITKELLRDIYESITHQIFYLT